jgi:N-acetylglucosaminyldiphosphoundecaprenol N-acetyl-beta-D-mannosaminyltransferase
MGFVELFGLRFHNVDLDETVDCIELLLRTNKHGLVLTPNTDHIVKLSRDKSFQEAYRRGVMIVADGAPVVWASRLLGEPLKARVAGATLLPALCERAAQRGWKLFFLGGKPGVAYRAATKLTKQFPGLNVVGTYAPPSYFESDRTECQRIITKIREARPDILFIGVGAPKQEKWSAAHFDALGVPLICCTGAAFDFAAGVVRRAPPWMQRIGLEWMFRLLQEPKRLWRRYLVDFLIFIPIVLSEWVAKKLSSKRASP